MQRLSRGVASLLQRHVAADALHQAQQAQYGLLTTTAVGAQAAVQQAQGWQQQAQPWHSSARCNCTSSSTSSSSGRDGPWAPPPPQQHHHHHSHLQHHFTLPQQPVWHRSLHAAHISLSSPAFAGRALSTSCSPWQQPAVAESADAPDSSPDRGPALSPAADPKPIVGVCKRRNLKCGWKKIDFVLRMIRRSTVDDAMAQLSANPKKAAVFVKHAVANARNNAICAGGDPQKLYVAEVFVTKGKVEKRLHFMGRGYSSVKQTRFSHLNVRVQQMDDQAAAAVMLRPRPKLIAPLMARMQGGRSRTSRGVPVKGGSGSGSSSGSGMRHQVARA